MFSIFFHEKSKDDSLYEIKNVTKNNIEMKGVFALQNIPPNTYLCSYVGDLEDCVKRVEFLNKLEKEDSKIHESYDMAHPSDPNLTLVPVDENGKIKEKFILSPAIYFNEASGKNEFPNLRYVPNYSTNEINLITISEVEKGKELLGYYGNHYNRSWDIWWWNNSTPLEQYKYFGGFVKEGNKLTTISDEEIIDVQGLKHIPLIRKVAPKRRKRTELEDEEQKNVKEPKSEASFKLFIHVEEKTTMERNEKSIRLLEKKLMVLRIKKLKVEVIDIEKFEKEIKKTQIIYRLPNTTINKNKERANELFNNIKKEIDQITDQLEKLEKDLK